MIVFNTCGGIDVHVDIPAEKDDPDQGTDLATYHLMWDEDPIEFARDLRSLADFIEHHSGKEMKVEVSGE